VAGQPGSSTAGRGGAAMWELDRELESAGRRGSSRRSPVKAVAPWREGGGARGHGAQRDGACGYSAEREVAAWSSRRQRGKQQEQRAVAVARGAQRGQLFLFIFNGHHRRF
jgi:hypothetical protein